MKKALSMMLILVIALTALSLTAFAKGETNYVTGVTVDGPAYQDRYNGNLADGQVGTSALTIFGQAFTAMQTVQIITTTVRPAL